jgi:mono/diheme cytochrome c family protein
MLNMFFRSSESKIKLHKAPSLVFKDVLMVFAFAGAATLLGSVSVLAQDDIEAGRKEFSQSCMTCHGESGRGDGEMAKYLTIKPADLTALSKNNNGQYPFLRVFQTIDGRAAVKAHGAGPMPIWGERYTVDSGAAGAEPYKTYSAEPFVRARILELTYYIQSLQK